MRRAAVSCKMFSLLYQQKHQQNIVTTHCTKTSVREKFYPIATQQSVCCSARWDISASNFTVFRCQINTNWKVCLRLQLLVELPTIEVIRMDSYQKEKPYTIQRMWKNVCGSTYQSNRIEDIDAGQH